MGFLAEGKTLTWEESAPYRQYIKDHGILQFVALYNRLNNRPQDEFKWGDEVEYVLVKIPEDGFATICTESAKYQKIGNELAAEENLNIKLLPEYGSFMIEATPGTPYGDTTQALLSVEDNLRLRRQTLERIIDEDVYLFTVGNFSMLGTDTYLDPPSPAGQPIAESLYVSDDVINPHPRFGTLTKNIRTRRGENVDIHIPIFQDENTPEDIVDIHMDAMSFGMGCCCLQVTFQARTLWEARCLYDQLAILTPIMMALGASTPFHRGMISDIDCRWTVISQSVDDRTEMERGVVPLEEENGQQQIAKSRYDTIDCFLCECTDLLDDNMNDIDLVIDQDAYETLRTNGIDDRLAKHFAHLWIREPLVIYSHRIEVDDDSTTEHFENIQSTNWQNVRFKPPPPNSDIGWRVEFRTMEIQLTEFENAAYVVFVALLNRAILYFKLNLYTYLTQVDENMVRAHQRDAINTQTFFFKLPKMPNNDYEPVIEELTLAQIFCGTENHPGLLHIVSSYLDEINCTGYDRERIDSYLNLIRGRSTGEIETTATMMRNFVTNHNEYAQDSMLTPQIYKDLLLHIDQRVKESLEEQSGQAQEFSSSPSAPLVPTPSMKPKASPPMEDTAMNLVSL